LWDRSDNYRQLTIGSAGPEAIGAIKSDELHVRTFVADETRIYPGVEFWDNDGDAVLKWHLTNGRTYAAGIDTSNIGDAWHIGAEIVDGDWYGAWL
jgi:hypothetical protein